MLGLSSSSMEDIAHLQIHDYSGSFVLSVREPSQRPDMAMPYALDPLVEQWTPTTATTGDDSFNIDFNVSLPQALQRWKVKDDSMLYEDTNVD
ncbi:hypothetical protein HAX54_033021 [Datura stramonium]|uniref:Uncharacterized protein n=1 Tax=Datura stramonium TaxID=4076 RepID=A0ABS8VEY8_DATST|nr:hypothetical protein [Datura stramonium]